MKKLMVAIAAVATAFGLYAADFAKHTIDFSSTTEAANYDLAEIQAAAQGKFWSYDGQTNGEYEATTDLIAGAGVLTLKTGSKVLSRHFLDVADADGAASFANTNLYIDMTLDFDGQALDDVPAADGAKIALFALEGTTENGAPEGTNFFVKAAYGTENGAALFQLLGIDAEDVLTGARRIAVKTYPSVSGSRAGFLIYIAQTAIGDQTLDPVVVDKVYAIDAQGNVNWTPKTGDYLGGLTMASTVAKWVQQKSLFVSMDSLPATGSTLTSVDFVGNAKLTKIALTDDDPGFPEDFQVMTIAGDSVAITNVTGAILAGNTIQGVDGDQITIYPAITKALARVIVSGTTVPAFAPAQESYNLTFVDKATIKVEQSDVAATVNDVAYATIADAVSAAITAATTATNPVAFVLSKGIESGAALNFSPENDLAVSIVLDLAGNKITNNNATAAVVTVGQKAVLTITDSVGNGEIVATGNFGSTVVNHGKLTIEKGVFIGEVYIDEDAKDTAITGGKFDQAHNSQGSSPDWTFKLASAVPTTTHEVADLEDGYWTVREVSTFAVKFEDGANSTITPAAGTSNFVAGTAITVIATPNDEFEYAADSYDGWEKQSDGTLTKDVTVTAPATYTAPAATAIKYLIRFVSGEGVQTNEYNQANGETTEVPTPAEVTGKSFKEWSPAVVSPVVGAADYTAIYTANVFTVTFYGDEQKTNTIDVQSVEYNGYVTEVPAPTRDGFEFQGWNEATNVAIKVDKEFWATWKAAGPWPVDPTTPAEVTQKLYEEGFSTTVIGAITTVEQYQSFKGYCNSIGVTPATGGAAKDNAFIAYALGCATAITKDITSDDVKIATYDAATGAIEVKIEGVTPGEPVDSTMLAKVLTAIGGEELDDMGADNVNVIGQCVENAKIKVTVTPKTGTPAAFFTKVKLIK